MKTIEVALLLKTLSDRKKIATDVVAVSRETGDISTNTQWAARLIQINEIISLVESLSRPLDDE